MTTYGWVGLSGGLEPGKNELYTLFPAVEEGLRRYRHCFAGKTVFCNCDDPFESNFVKYFIREFKSIGLKKLIATSCLGSPVAGEELQLFPYPGVWDVPVPAHKLVVRQVPIPKLDDLRLSAGKRNKILIRLKGDGDFRSKECVRLLRQADIAVTAPPFSQFGEYLTLLVRHDRKFLLLGRFDSITDPVVLQLIRESRVRPDFGNPCGGMLFRVPGICPADGREPCRRVKVCWFTNLK